MSATILSEAMVIQSHEETTKVGGPEIQSATCGCCGLTEDCTPGYIERVRERYLGRWICGLCAEAIQDEIVRSKRLISTEEAMAKHQSFFSNFKVDPTLPPVDPTSHLISAVRQLLRRSLDSPRAPPSPNAATPRRGPGLARAESCFSTL